MGKDLKQYYRLRSKIVHGSSMKSNNITIKTIFEIRDILRKVLIKLLEITKGFSNNNWKTTLLEQLDLNKDI